MTNSWRWWAPLVAYMALIFYASSRPRPGSLDQTPDVLLHASAYFLLALLAVRAFARGLRAPGSQRAFFGGLALALAYGASDEWHQSHVAERVGSWLDLWYDGLGVAAAGVAIAVWWRLSGERT